MSESANQMVKATEEILRILENSKNESELAMDRFPGIFLVTDQSGKIIRKNNSFLKLFPMANELMTIYELFHEVGSEKIHSILDSAQERLGMPFEFELNFKERNLNLALSVYAWKIESGRFAQQCFYSIAGQDVTQLKQAFRVNEILKREISSAEQVQSIMLPQKTFENEYFQLCCEYKSASECGGDLLYYQVLDEKLRIFAGDVTGHGVGPAMIAGAVRAAISIFEQGAYLDPLVALRKLNQCILDITKGSYWMSFQIVDFDFKNSTVEVVQAAHTPIYSFDFSDSSKKSWRDVGVFANEVTGALGSSSQPTFSHEKVQLTPGHVYMSFSDGLFEATNDQGEVFELRRPFTYFLNHYQSQQNLPAAIDHVYSSLMNFMKQQPLKDDVSIWCLKFKKPMV